MQDYEIIPNLLLGFLQFSFSHQAFPSLLPFAKAGKITFHRVFSL